MPDRERRYLNNVSNITGLYISLYSLFIIKLILNLDTSVHLVSVQKHESILRSNYIKKHSFLFRRQVKYKNYSLRSNIAPWPRVLSENLKRPKLLKKSRNSPHFMDPEGSLPHLQKPATRPYPEPD
jgi:hypothetical protein